jgi:GrpB-like predicted nucleotidyltransferase (UPF0157 family)
MGAMARTEEELRAVTIGELDRLNGPVTLVPYDPAWPELFAREERRIRAALGAHALHVDHVGSTSVPGLAAKPIVDIVLRVAGSADEPAWLPALEASGYVLRIREPSFFEHRMLRGPDTKVNLHVYSDGCTEVARMLLFRDWMRAHDDERDLYERTKRALAARTWDRVQSYADAKSDVVREILARADAAAHPA